MVGRVAPNAPREGRDRRAFSGLLFAAAAFAGIVIAFHAAKWLVAGIRESLRVEDEYIDLLATGYCNCGQCCGWRYDDEGRAVYDYGPMKGRRKEVGRTSTGATAHPGTIAADPKFLRMGTRLHVPGYGMGRVEDVGGAIKGAHVDLWFPTHEAALQWGTRRVKARVLRD